MAKRKAEAETSETETNGTAGMNKTEAVKAALAEGVNKPLKGVEFIKSKFGIDITPQMFSAYKSGMKKKAGGSNEQVTATSGSSNHGKSSQASPAELARQVKALVAQYGADNVSDMLAVLTD